MDDANNFDRLLKVTEVSQTLRVSTTQVYRLLATELPCVRFGGSVRIRPEDLKQYMIDHLETHAQNGDQHR